jgi:hypothetical protein
VLLFTIPDNSFRSNSCLLSHHYPCRLLSLLVSIAILAIIYHSLYSFYFISFHFISFHSFTFHSGEAVYTAYLEKTKRTSVSILGWEPQSLREDLRKFGWTGRDVEDAVTYWSSLPRGKSLNISHHITSHHITSHHITSHHITSHHITSHHITSHHITSHHSTSFIIFKLIIFLDLVYNGWGWRRVSLIICATALAKPLLRPTKSAKKKKTRKKFLKHL